MPGFLITFGSGSPVTLGDDANGLTVDLQELGLKSLVSKIPAYGAANPTTSPQGNAEGPVSFTSTKSYDTIDDMITALKGYLAMINQTDTLVLARGDSTMTFAGAILQDVHRVPGTGGAGSNGVKLTTYFKFQITTIT